MKKDYLNKIQKMCYDILLLDKEINNSNKMPTQIDFGEITRVEIPNHGYIVCIDNNNMVQCEFEDLSGTTDWLPLAMFDTYYIREVYSSVETILNQLDNKVFIQAIRNFLSKYVTERIEGYDDVNCIGINATIIGNAPKIVVDDETMTLEHIGFDDNNMYSIFVGLTDNDDTTHSFKLDSLRIDYLQNILSWLNKYEWNIYDDHNASFSIEMPNDDVVYAVVINKTICGETANNFIVCKNIEVAKKVFSNVLDEMYDNELHHYLSKNPFKPKVEVCDFNYKVNRKSSTPCFFYLATLDYEKIYDVYIEKKTIKN